jgi:hypothetical protein
MPQQPGPIYVLTDDAYDRILNRLQAGERFVWTYSSVCPHQRTCDCDCPKRMNVLVDGQVVRLQDGRRTPVLPHRALRGAEPTERPLINVSLSRVRAEGARYVNHLKAMATLVESFPCTIKLYDEDAEATTPTTILVNEQSMSSVFDRLSERCAGMA